MSNISSYIDDYYTWLKSKTDIIKGDNGWNLVITPFVGIFNDNIEIYIKQEYNNLYITDHGNTLDNLKMIGVNMQGSQKRRNILNGILFNYGIKTKNNELYIECDKKNFAQAKYNFVSALLEINDLEILSESNVKAIFKDDVKNWFDENRINYDVDLILRGGSGLEFTFDFHMSSFDNEIISKSFNSVTHSNLTSFLYAFNDVKTERESINRKKVNAVAIINDLNKKPSSEYLEAIKNDGAKYILWSEKDKPENISDLKIA